MKSAWLLTLITAFLYREANSFQWTSNFNNVYACENQSSPFPWTFTLEGQERLEDIKWYYDPPNGTRQNIANFVNGLFSAVPGSFYGRLIYVAQAGVNLMHITTADIGNYSVEVLILENRTIYNQSPRWAILDVTDGSEVTVNGTPEARQEAEPVFDIFTNQLAVQLSCGGLSVEGDFPLSVEWTTPTGEKTVVYKQTNGRFFYTLPNPVPGGEYTCRLARQSPPLKCLEPDDTIFQNVSVTVDEVRARLSILEGRQKISEQENKELEEKVKRLNNSETVLQNELNKTKDYIKELESKKVRFDVRATGDPYYDTDFRVRFDQVITNDGNAFNQDSSIFTAPFNGTYFFVITGAQYNDRAGGLLLGDNDTPFCRLQMPVTRSVGVSCQATVYLTKGEEVWVKSEGQVYLSSPYSSFVGFSLDPDFEVDVDI